jgi:DNA invertase Pin-like site-specific DNA recombinase
MLTIACAIWLQSPCWNGGIGKPRDHSAEESAMAQVDLSRISESDQRELVRLLKRVMGMPDEPKAAVAVMSMTAPARRRVFAAYLRVSTDRQGRSGLGLEAQRDKVASFVAAAGGRIVSEHIEVESARKANRPELAKALAACRAHHATLIVARLDRLTRDVRFLHEVQDGVGPAGVQFCDMPDLTGAVGKFMVGQLALVAQFEAELVSERTKAALAAAKARGVRLGNPRPRGPTPGMEKAAAAARAVKAQQRAGDVAPVIEQIRGTGVVSLRAIASELRCMEVPTPSGRGSWHAVMVARVIATADRPIA